MYLPLASNVPLLLVNLSFALVALAVGFVAGAWLLGRRQGDTNADTNAAGNAGDDLQKQRERERTEMASLRLRDLATGVASDVGEHSGMVAKITADLQSLDPTNLAETGEGIFRALGQIVAANSQLQNRLAQAEQQIAAQAAEIRAHETEARTDSLTGLSNRRAFDDEIARRFAEWQRKHTTFSLLILDIDHFKKFNDSHGHPAGDEVLRATGKVLKQACRDMDLACRYGGEEFAVVLPTTGVIDGKNLVERVRRMVESMSVKFEGKTLRVTASIGIAEVNGTDDSARLIKRADEALYASKAAGRNCGHLHDGKHSVPITPGLQAAAVASEPAAGSFVDRLPNRTRFIEELRRRIAESTRTHLPLSVAVLAIDDFAAMKSKLSATNTLQVLDAVSEFVVESLREMDLVGRIEEGKLAVLMPGNALVESQQVIERVLLGLDGTEMPLGTDAFRISTSAAIVQNSDDDTAASLLQRAEKKLAEQLAAAVVPG